MPKLTLRLEVRPVEPRRAHGMTYAGRMGYTQQTLHPPPHLSARALGLVAFLLLLGVLGCDRLLPNRDDGASGKPSTTATAVATATASATATATATAIGTATAVMPDGATVTVTATSTATATATATTTATATAAKAVPPQGCNPACFYNGRCAVLTEGDDKRPCCQPITKSVDGPAGLAECRKVLGH